MPIRTSDDLYEMIGAIIGNMKIESDASYVLARRYDYDDELSTQYSTEARTWRSAARMLERMLLDE